MTYRRLLNLPLFHLFHLFLGLFRLDERRLNLDRSRCLDIGHWSWSWELVGRCESFFLGLFGWSRSFLSNSGCLFSS